MSLGEYVSAATRRGMYRDRVSRDSDKQLRRIFVALVSFLALVHMIAVSLSALPDNRYSEAAEPFTSYLGRYFTQNWRLFAPNPVSSDRGVLMQGAYLDDAGVLQTTSWVDWTDVELDLVRHHLIGNRGGYTTSKLYSTLKSELADLDDERQRRVATNDDPKAVPSWNRLRSDLIGAGSAPSEPVDSDIVSFLRYDAAMTRLTSEVMESRWPDLEFAAVRYALRSQSVTPYNERHGTNADRERARPEAETSVRGWRKPLYGSDAERRAVAGFDRRHR